MPLLSRLRDSLARRWQNTAASLRVARGHRVLHGPARVTLGPQDVAVVALMRDAEYFVEGFLHHHFAQGAAHVLIVDNGSTDRTTAIAAGFDRVTVVQNRAPARRFESRLRAQTARRVLTGGWLLFVDADERFEAPLNLPLPRLAAYLDAQGYTAMVAHMLDLYAPAPYGETRGMTLPETLAAFSGYALDGIDRIAYHDRSQIAFNWFLRENRSAPGIALLQGGLRREIFGETPFLSKHSLVKNARGIQPMTHPHCASGVDVADVTGLLRHYKLAGPWLDRDRASVAAGTWDHAEDARRLAAATAGDAFTIAPKHPQIWQGSAKLLDQGFLQASDRYRAFVSAASKDASPER